MTQQGNPGYTQPYSLLPLLVAQVACSLAQAVHRADGKGCLVNVGIQEDAETKPSSQHRKSPQE